MLNFPQWKRRPRRARQFVRDGRRVVPTLVLDPPQPEEAPLVRKYLGLADQALDRRPGPEWEDPEFPPGPTKRAA